MIELTCPQCSNELEIDDGFRGGVCRCFNCGTLMTVPDDPAHEKAESLGRPDAPGGRPDAPGKKSGSTTSQIREKSRTKGQKFVTASGKSIDLSKVPTAKRSRRRVIVRTTIVALFAVILISLIVVTVYTIRGSNTPKVEKSASEIAAAEFGYDPQINPLLLAKPNFMGLPLAGRVVLMSDSSSTMRDSLDAIKAAIKQSVKTAGDRSMQVVLWREKAPFVYPSQLLPSDQISATALASKLDETDAAGEQTAIPAFKKALESKPELITLVARSMPGSREQKELANLMKGSGVRLNVVMIDRDDNDARKLADASDGKYIVIGSGDLQRWFEQFNAKK